MIEIKIGKVYPHHGIQLAGQAMGAPYPKLTDPLAKFMFRRRMVVELRANGTPKVHPFNERSDYEAFVSLLYITCWKQRFANTYKENQ
jgi:hypothetical protein